MTNAAKIKLLVTYRREMKGLRKEILAGRVRGHDLEKIVAKIDQATRELKVLRQEAK